MADLEKIMGIYPAKFMGVDIGDLSSIMGLTVNNGPSVIMTDYAINDGVASTSKTLTIPAGSDRLLIMVSASEDKGYSTDYYYGAVGSDAMGYVGSDYEGGLFQTRRTCDVRCLYEAQLPSSGELVIRGYYSQTMDHIADIFVLFNNVGATALHDESEHDLESNYSSVNANISEAGNFLIVDGFCIDGGSGITITEGAAQTKVMELDNSTYVKGACSYRIVSPTAATDYPMTWSASAVEELAHVTGAFKINV